MAPPLPPQADLFRRFDEALLRRPLAPEEFGSGGFESSDGTRCPDEAHRECLNWFHRWEVLCSEARVAEQELAMPRLPPGPQAELADARATAEDESSRWEDSLWGGLRHARKRVAALAQHADNGAFRGQVQVVARGVERELEVFKAQQRQEYDTLAGAEQELREDALLALGRRAEAWAAEPSALTARRRASEPPRLALEDGAEPGQGGSSSSSRLRYPSVDGGADGGSARLPQPSRLADDPEACELQEQVAALDAELRAHGETGGWPRLEHLVFARVLRMFNGKVSPAFRSRLQQSLPEKKEAEVQEHVVCYREHEARVAKRRELLARYRARRVELEHQAAEAQARQAAEEAAQRRCDEDRKRAAAEPQRRKVAEWRQSRSEEEERTGTRESFLSEQRALREREARRDVQEQQREAIEVFRSQRDAVRQEQVAKEEAAMRAAAAARRSLSQDERQRIAHRSAEMLRKKLQQVQVAGVGVGGASGRAALPARGSSRERRTLNAPPRRTRSASLRSQCSQASVEEFVTEAPPPHALPAPASTSGTGGAGVYQPAQRGILRTAAVGQTCPPKGALASRSDSGPRPPSAPPASR